MKPTMTAAELAAFRKLDQNGQLRQLRGTKVERAFVIERAGAIDEKARTVWLSIASEEPYARWWGVEVLDMKKESIRQDRLKSGAPLLVGHDSADQVGIVEGYEITAEKKLRILARFGRSGRAEEIFHDVLDGIRKNASVGYIIHDLVLEKQEEDVATYRVTDWEPLEGSLVAIPADPSVGVGRELETAPKPSVPQQGKITMDPKDISPELRAQIAAEERAKLEKEARAKAEAAANTPEAIAKREQERVSSILKAGTEYKEAELAAEIAQDPKATVETFKARLLEKQRTAQKSLGHGNDVRTPHGSGARVIMAGVGQLRAFRDLPIEGGGVQKAEEGAYRAGMWLAAAIHNKDWAKKWCREHGMPLMYRDAEGNIREMVGAEIRAQNENVLGLGGALVPIEMEAAIINLRDQYGVARRLARLRTMGNDTLKIPRRKSGLTAYFFQDDDGVGITESNKNWDNVTLSAKKLGALTKVSRDLVEDAIISVVDDLAGEMAYAFAIKEDQCMLIGDGTSTYGGIRGINNYMEASSYISKYAAASGHPTFATVDNADLTGTMGNLAQYADTPQAVWVCSHLAKHALFNRLKAIAGGNRVDTLGNSPDNTYLGYQIITSEAMPKVTSTLNAKVMVLFGRFDLGCSLGNRRGIEMQTLMERYAELGQIGVIATERFDLVVHDLGTTSTADVNGGRGPIAALQGTT
jgi:HK97 family phage major capsid protein